MIKLMKRTLYSELIQWKLLDRRKPLILKGARQTGKTWLLTEFGRHEFRQMHYINFQRSENFKQVFEGNLSPDNIILQLEFILDTTISRKEDLLFFDEIQDCSRALTSLKYFNEDLPEMAVVCAGSLLGVVHSDSSFPVGKVNFLDLYPLSFEEFLMAIGEDRSVDFINSLTLNDSISAVIHNKLMDLLKEYMVTGGMPEVVQLYAEYRDNKYVAFNRVREKQEELLTSYRGDFPKYSGKVNASKIVSVFEAVPSQLARENRKFVPSQVISGGRFSRLRSSIDWLIGAGLVIPVKISNSGELPFAAFTKENRFKLYMLDTGLLGALGGLAPKAIYLQNDLFVTFRGAFCENFVAQEFLAAGQKKLYSWMSNTSELEFLCEIEAEVYPIEVKAGLSGKLKSLNVFAEKYAPPYRTRISGRNLEINRESGMHSYPLYLAGKFPLK